MTLLLFEGAATAERLAEALRLPLNVLRDVVARLEMAGYARRSAGAAGPQIELTPHAREWIDRIWEPLRHRGTQMLAAFSRRTLARSCGCSDPRARFRSGTSPTFGNGWTSPRGEEKPSTRRPVAGRPAARSGVRRGEHRPFDPHSRSRQSRRTQRPSLRACVQDIDGCNPSRVCRAASNRARPRDDRDYRSAAGRDRGRHRASRRRATSRRPFDERPASPLPPIAGADEARGARLGAHAQSNRVGKTGREVMCPPSSAWSCVRKRDVC